MAKSRTHYLCRECGGVQSTWMGKCPDCGAWDALERYLEPKASPGANAPIVEGWTSADGHPAAPAAATPLPEIAAAEVARATTGVGEFDRVLGGGLVAGSAVLLGGDPGIGKSTLLLQSAARLARAGRRVLYVSSEESAYQTRLRAERLFADAGAIGSPDHGAPGDTSGNTSGGGDTSGGGGEAATLEGLRELYILAETNLARIVEQARRVRPEVLVADSIQMIHLADVPASPGSVTQLRRCCHELVALAKTTGMAVLLVGHVTKQGNLAGPKLLEHLVDTVLSFEGDRHHAHRIVRAIKNRFGTTLEVAIFEMTGRGLREVADGILALDPGEPARPGSVVCPAMHGSRCLLVEVQALTATGVLGSARRKAAGLDPNRLALLIAVLEQHGGLRLADQDVFVSAVGGLKVTEPASDLPLGLAIAGAHGRKALPRGLAAVGEVGLGGEVRRVNQIEQRMNEAARLGYRGMVLPAENARVKRPPLQLHPVRTLAEAVELLASTGPTPARGTRSGSPRAKISE